MRDTLKNLFMNGKGQTTLQLILPLIILLLILVGIAFIVPNLSPVKTMALAAGMAIFVISFVSTEFGLFILIFSMLLSPEFVVGTTGGASLGRGVTLRLDDFLLVIIGFSWLAKMSIHKELGLFLRTPLNKPIAFYIIICLVSTLFGAIFGRVNLVTGFFFVLKYFEYMIVYFIVANHLESNKQVQNYLWAMLITCAIVSLIGIAQIPEGHRVSAPFEGEVGEPNTFGGYLVFMLSIVVGLFLTTPSFRNQLIYGALAVLFATPLFYTQSRSSYLAAIPAMLTFLLLSEKKQWILAAILLLGVTLPFIAPQAAKERVMYTFTQGQRQKNVVEVGGVKLDTSLSARIVSWRQASRDYINHPFLGYGVTGYRFLDAQYARVALETGFLGIFFFFILLYTIFRQTYDSFKVAEDPVQRGLAMGFLAGFAGLLFHSIGSNTFIIVRIMEPFWFITAMVIMTPHLKKVNS
ncbi:MAG: O-antigen ligase family protein [Deltaproteobacteria bacterium]|nr:O-antigen ligase family protein [Deltaproteobacteria bacterium]